MADDPTAKIDEALDPKNFPRWAQACPESFRAMKLSLLGAALKMAAVGLTAKQQTDMGAILGPVAAVCFAAGQKSVDEARANGLDVKDLN